MNLQHSKRRPTLSQDPTPFDFINSASFTKEDLIRDSENPEYTEKKYNAYIVNRGMSMNEDTILHANEMNLRHYLFNDAQYRYYLQVLRKRKRYSKWQKHEGNGDLDLIQEVYQVSRTVAKQYLRVLTKDHLKALKEKRNTGG
jgi:hypothetical protein